MSGRQKRAAPKKKKQAQDGEMNGPEKEPAPKRQAQGDFAPRVTRSHSSGLAVEPKPAQTPPPAKKLKGDATKKSQATEATTIPVSNSSLTTVASNAGIDAASSTRISSARIVNMLKAATEITEFFRDLQQMDQGDDPAVAAALAGLREALLPTSEQTAKPSARMSAFASFAAIPPDERKTLMPSSVLATPPMRMMSSSSTFTPPPLVLADSSATLTPAVSVPPGTSVFLQPPTMSVTKAPLEGLEAKGPAPDAPERPAESEVVQESDFEAVLEEGKSEAEVAPSRVSMMAMPDEAMPMPGEPMMAARAPIDWIRPSPPHPMVTGRFLKGRDTKEWAYYSNNSTNGFGLGLCGGGSRACTSAWGLLNSLHDGGYVKFSTFAFMSANSGGTWCLLPLLYAPREAQQNYYSNSEGADCSVQQILGDYYPATLLTSAILNAPLNDTTLAGYGTTKMGKFATAASGWWTLVDNAFSVPRNIGQGSSPANWQICTFGSTDTEIFEEVLLSNSNAKPDQLLQDSFKVAARTKPEGCPIPIAVGCAYYSKKYPYYWVYPVEFTPSCSGAFRDVNSAPVQDTLGNPFPPDYLISNALFGASKWEGGSLKNQIMTDMPALSTFPRFPGDRSSLGMNEFMSVSSNAPGLVVPGMEYSMNTAVATTNTGVPVIKPYKYVDGGTVDNAGLMPLVQRRLAHITVVICNALDYFGPNSPNLDEIADLSRHFEHPTDVLHNSDPLKIAKEYEPMHYISSCFPKDDLLTLFAKLKTNFINYGTAVATMQHTLAPKPACKDFYGLSGPFYENYAPVVTWYIVQRPQLFGAPTLQQAPFWASLDPSVLDIYRNLSTNGDNFPYYSTSALLELNSLQANAMKYYTSAMSDYYMLPHLRKNNTPYHIWVSANSRTIRRKEYFQLDNSKVAWSPAQETKQAVTAVSYSPLVQDNIIAYADSIQCGPLPIPNIPYARIKCVLHTVSGIVVGGVTTGFHPTKPNSALLGIFSYAKNISGSGVISFSVGKYAEILPTADPKMQQLTAINYLCSRNDGEIALLGEAVTNDVPLYWKMTLSTMLLVPNPGVNSSGPSKLSATKLLTLRRGLAVIWCKDPNNSSFSAVQMLVDGAPPTNVQLAGCRIFDVMYCPLLSGVLIFFANDSGGLSTQLVRRNRFGDQSSLVLPVVVSDAPLSVNILTSIVFAEYQGNVLCVRVDGQVYVMTSAGPLHFTLSEVTGLPPKFLPAKIW